MYRTHYSDHSLFSSRSLLMLALKECVAYDVTVQCVAYYVTVQCVAYYVTVQCTMCGLLCNCAVYNVWPTM